MASPIQEYLIGLGFKLDEPGAKRFDEMLGRTGKTFAHVGAQAVEMASAIGLAVEKVAAQYEDLYYLSQRTGATVQSLQATAYGFTQIGLSAGDAKSMVDGLAMTLRTQPGTGGLLSALGVGAGDANKQAHDLVKQLSHMPFYVASQYAGTFGISPMQLLQMENGLADLDRAEADHIRRQNEMGINTKKLGEDSHEFMTELRKLGDEFGLLETKVGQDFVVSATTFTKQLESMLEWIGKVDTRTGGWVTTLGGLGVALGGIVALKKSVGWIAGLFGGGLPKVAPLAAPAAEAGGIGLAGILGRITRGGAIPAALAALTVVKEDASHGNRLRSKLRDILGVKDDHEPAPWAPGGSWGNKPGDSPNDTLKQIRDILHDIFDKADKNSPFGDLSDVAFGGAANPFNKGGAGGPAPAPSDADSAALTREGQARAQPGWWTPQRQEHAIQTLVAGGVSPLGAAGLVSRWANVESAGGPASVNPTSGAFGIGQWLGPRKTSIAGDTDFDHQLAHVLAELHSTEAKSLSELNAAKTAWDAARGASQFERAEGYDPATGVDNFTRTTALGIAGIKTPVAAPPTAPATPPTWAGGLDSFPSASRANAIPTTNLSSYFGPGAPSTPLGGDVHTGDRNVTVSPTVTMNVHGGADPKVTADYALAGLDSSWANLVRNAGATVR